MKITRSEGKESFTAGSGQPEVTCLAPDSLLAEPVSVLDLDLRWVQKEEVGGVMQMDKTEIAHLVRLRKLRIGSLCL